MYCPKCRIEYRNGFVDCVDCLVSLLPGTPPPEPSLHFDPNLDLVVILETNSRIQLALANGLLDDAEIPYFVLGPIATLVTDVDPFLKKWVHLQVPGDRESEARELLGPVLHPIEPPQIVEP